MLFSQLFLTMLGLDLLKMLNISILTPVFASVSGGTVDTSSWQPENFKGLIEIAVRTLFIVGGVAFVILFLIGAIRYITSGGDAKAVDGAKKNITAAIVGVLILASVYTVAWFFNRALGAPTFGGIVSWQGATPGRNTAGITWDGNYDNCTYYKAGDTTAVNECSSQSKLSCCGSPQDCVNMRAVIAETAYLGTSACAKTLCHAVGASCSSPEIDWTCWANKYWPTHQDKANELCKSCNICAK